jgi:methylmalonyl-CoA/ethylmalonyl-CoA epimerase
MNKLPFTFHHLGLAARRQDSARRFAEALGYQVGETVLDPLQNVELAMCTHPRMPALEIVTPAPVGPPASAPRAGASSSQTPHSPPVPVAGPQASALRAEASSSLTPHSPPAARPGPLGQLLRTSTELVYHLCYEVPRIDTALEAIRGTIGTPRCVSEPKPAVLFDGRRVAFYLMSGCGLVELLEAS